MALARCSSLRRCRLCGVEHRATKFRTKLEGERSCMSLPWGTFAESDPERSDTPMRLPDAFDYVATVGTIRVAGRGDVFVKVEQRRTLAQVCWMNRALLV